jgi:aminopeptidase N
VVDEARQSIRLDACPTWVVANAGARGYYRTDPGPDAVRRMADNVAPLSAAERIMLLSDGWALARSTRHAIGVFLDLARGFTAERSDAVLQALTVPLAAIGEDIASPAVRPQFRSWVSSLLTPALTDAGWVGKAQEPDATRSLRATVVAALGYTARDAQVLARASTLVRQELDEPGSIEPTLLNVIVPLAALQGDVALYERYLARAKTATDPEEKYRYLYGLGEFGDPALVRRTMDFILGPEVRAQDTSIFLGRLLRTPDARPLAWDLIQQRSDAIEKKDPTGTAYVVNSLGAFCDPAAAQEIRAFFATHEVPDAERALAQTVERVDSCARFAAAQRPHLDAWFARRR